MKFYQYKDSRTIVAPFGVFSDGDLRALFEAKNAKGRPLGRNCIRFWLYLLTRASGRKKQGYEVSQANIKDVVGLSKSSTYEALNDLLFAGFLWQPIPDRKEYFLATPTPLPLTVTSLKSQKKSLKDRTTNQETSSEVSKKLPLTPKRGLEEKGTIGWAIQSVIEKTPWLIGGSIYDSKEGLKESILHTSPDMLITRLVMNGEHSLLRTHGYHGTQRKRTVKIEMEGILGKLQRNEICVGGWEEQFKGPTLPPPLKLPKWFEDRHFTDLGCDDIWFEKVGEWRQILKEKMKSQYSIWISPLNFTVIARPYRFPASDDEDLVAVPYDDNDDAIEGYPSLLKMVLITCPNRHFLEWVKKEYSQLIRETIGGTIDIDPPDRMGMLFVLSGWSGDNPNGPG